MCVCQCHSVAGAGSRRYSDSALCLNCLQIIYADLIFGTFTGVLMFDEMSVRRGLHLRHSDMSLLGKVDHGDQTRPGDEAKDGDHVLVFLFRPFLGGWSQTIGTFCAAGATPGPVLAKLVLQCIAQLASASVLVQALTCDNSTTNQAALKVLGMKLQYFIAL